MEPTQECAPCADGFKATWTNFWFAPANPVGLHALRVLSGLLFLACYLPLAGYVEEIFGLQGWVDAATLRGANRLPEGPPAPIGWSLFYLTEKVPALVQPLYWTAMVVFALFTLGIATRLTSVLTWVFLVSFLANPGTRLEVDYMLVIPAFYLMIGYLFLGQRAQKMSPVERFLGGCSTLLFAPLLRDKSKEEPPSSVAANLAMRLFQVHFALIVVTSCLHKLQSGDWWSGVALWYPMHPPYETTADYIRNLAPNRLTIIFFLSLVQYPALAWQLTFPMWAWRPRFRPLLVVGGLIGWAMCAWVYEMPLFGAFYFVGCLSFLKPEEWLWVIAKMKKAWQSLTRKESPKTNAKKPLPV
jgi:hypothetical protein